MRALCLSLVVLFSVPFYVDASSVVRTGDTVSITAEQSVEGDFYGLAGTVAISGEIAEDLLVAGERVTVNGTVGADVAILAASVNIDGVIADDVRIVAGAVTVAGEITGNLVVIANDLTVLSTAKIGGDILFFGNAAEISGLVGQDILGTSGQIRIDGEVLGGVDIKTDALTLGERAKITDDVTYSSYTEMVRAQNATVGGQVVRNDIVFPEENVGRLVAIPLLISLFAALVWYLLFRKFLLRVINSAQEHPTKSVAIGFGVFFLLPISAAILVVSTLGSVVGMSLLSFYLFLTFVALSFTGVLLGSYLAQLTTKKREISVVWIVVGVGAANLCLYLPLIGPIVIMGLFLLTLGALSLRLYDVLRGN